MLSSTRLLAVKIKPWSSRTKTATSFEYVIELHVGSFTLQLRTRNLCQTFKKSSKSFPLSNSNRTEWSTIRSVIIRVITRSGSTICLSRVSLQIKLDDTNSYQLIIKIVFSDEGKIAKLWKKRKIFIKRQTNSMVMETKVVIGWFKLQFRMRLVDLNYNFECDWFIELSDSKLSNKDSLLHTFLLSCVECQYGICESVQSSCK